MVTIIISFIIGVVASLLANIFTPSVVNLYVKRSALRVEKRIQKLEQQLEKYRKYLKDQTVFIAYIGSMFLILLLNISVIITILVTSINLTFSRTIGGEIIFHAISIFIEISIAVTSFSLITLISNTERTLKSFIDFEKYEKDILLQVDNLRNAGKPTHIA